MNTDIHRLLDEAFAAVEMTPETRDLKEEVRANLMARAQELEATGASPAAAAHRALDELGPIEELLGSPITTGSPTLAELHGRYKVRPRPGFVVRTTLLSVIAAAAIVMATLAALLVIPGISVAVLGYGLLGAAAIGFITADALRQETTSNYAMPLGRAVGYGVAAFLALGAVAAFTAFAIDSALVGYAIGGGVALFTSIGLFSWLGATQTNRHKQWVRTQQIPDNRFETDPAAAARFGIYTGVIWMVGIGAAIALAIAFAWWWALVVLGVCTVITLLILASMLFGSHATGDSKQ